MSLTLKHAAALVGLSAVLCGCSKHVETKETRSPDGRVVLRIEVDESGGAAVPDVTSAFLLMPNASPATKKLIFKGSAMSAFSAEWSGPGVITLSYTNGYVSACAATAELSAEVKVSVLGCK